MNVRKNFFIVRVIRHWIKLPREVIDVPWLSVFNRHSDSALIAILQLVDSAEVVRQLISMIFEDPIYPKHSILSYPSLS